MRVTDLTMERNFLYNIFNCDARLQKLQDQASSGKRITRPQDDPLGTERSIGLRHHLSKSNQYLRNLDNARTWMEETEQALSELTTVLSRAQELALYGGTGTTPPAAREAIASELEQLAEEVHNIAGTTIEGRKLLTGTMPQWKLSDDVTMTVPDLTALLSDAEKFISQLAVGLRTSSESDIEAATAGINSSLDGVLAARAENGAKIRRLDILEEKTKALDIEYQRLLSNVEDADLTEVIVRLKSQEAAYQAALAVGARLIQPSLLDHLR
ncbi:MAG: flagellar hook-associated protein FlgL [Candidatus Fermentithermobacillus carboniphilus]|uniref:Flagellar hook-associated protein FlgL n=1 Tax=Candidatus Fermentithermobacillus carboniphilus TaxID=3085328 RepID=A0AAT9LCK4_9FIRM|nr:MAG: flagellar hook-associated protein FlgL [Candidatus Fermentithermobacillus carboniphilus]